MARPVRQDTATGRLFALARALPFVWLLALALPGAAFADEIIERYLATIEVQADGDLLVSETIAVRAEGRQIRRGIYRDFPLQFRDAQGGLRSVTFELLGVSRDGHPEPHFTRSSAQGVRIYAGDEDRLLEPGLHRYEIRYRTGRQIRHPDGDAAQLYWNVTGNEWAFPIRSAGALLRLPGNAAPVRWTAYTGRFGERGRDFRARLRDDGQLEFETTRMLAPGEGLTLVAELPAGAVAAPSQAKQLRYALQDNRRWILGGLGLLAVAAFYLIAWRRVGRDPPGGTIIPLFHPPEGISPALAGYIRNWGWSRDWREFTAAAISLAVKGLLVFDDGDGRLVLKKRRPPETSQSTDDPKPRVAGRHALPSGESALLSWIEAGDGVAVIDRANGESLAGAQKDFRRAIEKENRSRFFRRNLGWFAAGLLLTAAAIGAVLRFGQLHTSELELLVIMATAGIFAGIFIAQIVRMLMPRRGPIAIAGVALPLVAAGFLAFAWLTQSGPEELSLEKLGDFVFDTARDNAFPLALVAGFAALNGIFYRLLRAPTSIGRKVMDQIEGLERYLRTAESARLNLQGAPELTSAHFEALLPYAVALGAEKPWSEAFEAAFARANPGADASTSCRPEWHRSGAWEGRTFADSLSGAVAAAQGSFASAMPAPDSGSSGFSDSGGSGGGGGGGGGGGW